MRVIICGAPEWYYEKSVTQEIERLRRESGEAGKRLLIIHGNVPGPETVARDYCRKAGIDTIVQEAVRRRGPDCYYRRNELMLSYHRPDLVVGFAADIRESPIVRDILERARTRGIRYKLVDTESLRGIGYEQDSCFVCEA